MRAVGHAEPGTYLARVRAGQLHGIEHPLDATVRDGEGETLQISDAAGGEGRQRERPCQRKALVAHQRERDLEPPRQLALVAHRLRRQPEHLGADLAEAGMKVAEALRLRRRAVRTGDVVPAGRVGEARPPRPGIAVDDCPPLHAGKADRVAKRGRQLDVGHAPAALQMPGTAVIVERAGQCTHGRRCSTSQACTSAAFLSGGNTG